MGNAEINAFVDKWLDSMAWRASEHSPQDGPKHPALRQGITDLLAAALRAERERQGKEIEALNELVKSLEGLLVCYRTGSHRHGDQVLTRLEKARTKLARIRGEQA